MTIGASPNAPSATPAARRTAQRLLLAVVAAAGIIAGLSLAQSAAEAAPSCSIYWTGNTTTSWTVPTNWSLSDNGATAGRVPNAADFVCMSSAPSRSAVSYVSVGRTVAGIDFSAGGGVQPSLTLSGGTLRLGSASGSFASVVNDIVLESGALLGGTADAVLTGSPSLSDDAILDGPGTTTLAAGTTVSTNGLILDNGRRLIVQGSFTHADCYDNLYLYGGSVLENAGRLTAASTCGQVIFSDGSAGAGLVNDAGATLAVVQAAADSYDLNVALDNRGTVTLNAGSLAVRPVSGSSGDYALPTGTELLIPADGRLHVSPGTISGSGTLVLDGGIIDVDAAASIPVLDLRGGTLTGDPTVAALTGGAGSVFTGGGVLTVPSGGTANVDSLTLDQGSRLFNAGRMTHSGCVDSILLQRGSVFENAGAFSVATTCPGSLGDVGIGSDGTPGSGMVNDASGSITVSLQRTSAVYLVDAPIDNRGSIEVLEGMFGLLSLSNLVSGQLTGGTYIATGGTLQIPEGIAVNAASVHLGDHGYIVEPDSTRAFTQLQRNAGTLIIDKGVQISTDLTNTGTLTVTAQTLQCLSFTQSAGRTALGSAATLRSTSGVVVVDGGTLTGSGKINNLAGAGTTAPDGTLTVSGVYMPAGGATLAVSVTGATAAEAGQLAVGGRAVLSGTLAIDTAAGVTPVVGRTYTILTSTAVSGTFSSITGQAAADGLYYEIGYGATSVTLTVGVLPQVSIDDAAQRVGDAGAAPMDFAVRLSAASSQRVVVDYRTIDGTAEAGLDYQAASGSLTFQPGETALTLTITIIRDSGPEPVEAFTVALGNPRNATLRDNAGTGTITHDGGAATLPNITGVTPAAVGQGANGADLSVRGQNFVPTTAVAISGGGISVLDSTFVDATTISITVAVAGGSGVGDRDVTVTTPGIGADTCLGCLTVTAGPAPTAATPALATGAVGRTVTITGANFQPGSTVAFSLGSAVTATTNYVSATSLRLSVTVVAGAPVGTYDVRVTNPDGGLGVCIGCFTVNAGPTVATISPAALGRGTSTPVTVRGTGFVTGATLTPPPDIAVNGVTVVNSTTITATMTVPVDRARGTNLPISVTNPAAGGYGVGTCRCLGIVTLIAIGDASQSVGDAGSATMSFTVALDLPTTQAVSVDYNTVAGSAGTGTDFVASSGTLFFPAQTTSLTVQITIVRDNGPEPVENFLVELSNPINAVISDSSGIGTITHDNGAGAIPTIRGLSPATVGAGAVDRQLTISGQGFTATSTVAVAGIGVPVTGTNFVSASTLVITVNAQAVAALGPRDVSVTNPGIGTGTCFGCLTVTPQPIPTSASASLATGATARTVTIGGTGFVAGASVAIIGQPGVQVVSTSYLSPNSLRLSVTVLSTAAVGTYDIRVTNPDGGKGNCLGCFTVTAGPVVSLILPGVAVRGTTTPVTITGAHFVNGAQVDGPTGVTFSNVNVVNSGTITATMTVSLTAPRGTRLPISVTNPAAGGYGVGQCRCLGITL